MSYTEIQADFSRKFSLVEMHRLVDAESRSREAIFPYIGGEEVNTSPTHAHHRYVIDFRNYPLRRDYLVERWADATDVQRGTWLRAGIVPLDYPRPVAADWPGLLGIVETKVKPERDVQKRKALRERWWQHADNRPGLYSAIARLDRVLANSQVSAMVQFAFLPSKMVYAHTLNIYPLQTNTAFCALQSRPHEIWARFLGSSMKDDLRYTPSDCFETFPFPVGWDTRHDLEGVGTDYYHFRADLMIRHDEGLTKTYNRFHDPDETDPEIARLRELHAAMDRAVLHAYDWTDIPTDCEFLLDYEIDEENWGTRKKPYRYRWPNDVRNEVLARLLELNAKRANEEALAGVSGAGVARSDRSPDNQSDKRSRRRHTLSQPTLWDHSGDG